MKILLVARTQKDVVNILRMMRPDAVQISPHRWRAGMTEYQVATIGSVFTERGFDRALIFFGGDGDRRLMTWVQQIVAPKMGGPGCELTVIA